MADSADPQRAVAVCVHHVLQAACDLAGALRVAAEEEGSRPAADCEVAEARLREAVLPAVYTAERDKPREHLHLPCAQAAARGRGREERRPGQLQGVCELRLPRLRQHRLTTCTELYKIKSCCTEI